MNYKGKYNVTKSGEIYNKDGKRIDKVCSRTFYRVASINSNKESVHKIVASVYMDNYNPRLITTFKDKHPDRYSFDREKKAAALKAERSNCHIDNLYQCKRSEMNDNYFNHTRDLVLFKYVYPVKAFNPNDPHGKESYRVVIDGKHLGVFDTDIEAEEFVKELEWRKSYKKKEKSEAAKFLPLWGFEDKYECSGAGVIRKKDTKYPLMLSHTKVHLTDNNGNRVLRSVGLLVYNSWAEHDGLPLAKKVRHLRNEYDNRLSNLEAYD